jgi:hypothetical protein
MRDPVPVPSEAMCNLMLERSRRLWEVLFFAEVLDDVTITGMVLINAASQGVFMSARPKADHVTA